VIFRTVYRNLDNVRPDRTREGHRPVPGRIRGDEVVARPQQGVADVIERGYRSVGDERRLVAQPHVFQDSGAQFLQAGRRRVDMEALVPGAFHHRLDDGRVRGDVVGVLPEPFQARRIHQLVKMGIADFKLFHRHSPWHSRLIKVKSACQQYFLACKNCRAVANLASVLYSAGSGICRPDSGPSRSE
jgi:hypothetical protein